MASSEASRYDGALVAAGSRDVLVERDALPAEPVVPHDQRRALGGVGLQRLRDEPAERVGGAAVELAEALGDRRRAVGDLDDDASLVAARAMRRSRRGRHELSTYTVKFTPSGWR